MIKSSKNTDFRFIKHRIKTFHQKKRISNFNPNKVSLTLDPKEDNPVYHLMRNEKTTKTVIDYILQSTLPNQHEKRRAQSEKFIIEKTHSPNFRAFSKNERVKTQKDVESFREKGEDIFLTADKIQLDLKKKKERLKILNKYVDQVDRYCSFIPKTYEQNEK